MGAILSKPKMPAPEPISQDVMDEQQRQKDELAAEKARTEQERLDEMQGLQKRKRSQRYGGRRTLLSPLRKDAETGVKKTTLG
jgi:hypothetical protein